MTSSIAAAAAYDRARPALAPTGGMSEELRSAAAEFARVMQQVDVSAQAAMTGASDTHQLVQSITQAQLALETAVSIRDKVVEAYQEILRMPV
nr:flagellar hook-basal body complex protein FliE [Paracoccus ravus]